ncbi:ribosomal RNA processing protein 36 homolog isoform X2 [Lingula anatina]|nr:ribosomal RNA processing protein 36 homolog isoform X2 [Lingula anatina]|eukprot:XP_013415255.1 ribosomal RNA processing protein 36 homolog isoform X2 [Lingula anatina]
MPFEELQKLKERLGSKLYKKALHGKAKKKENGKKKFKRENKNRPMEMSAKKPVGRFREIVSVKKKINRDPRFDDLSGEYSQTIFHQTYSFLDDLKSREKNKLLKQLKKEKDNDRKQQLHYLINRMNQQERSAEQKKSEKQFQKEIRKKEYEEIKQGKKPFYLRKSEQKQLQLADKFKELKKSGNLEKYLSKKRKKNASKDRKKLPI